MLAKWLRARPASSVCQCISCVSRGLVQRHPSQVNRSWNRLTILFYSSIISTAAAADARAKQKRRKRLDDAIAELEHSIYRSGSTAATLAGSEDSRTSEERGESNSRQQQSPISNVRRLSVQRGTQQQPLPVCEGESAGIRETGTGLAISEESDVDHLKKLIMFYIGRIKEGADRIDHRAKVDRSSVYASWDQRSTKQDTWSAKKMIMVEHSVGKLSARLLLEVTPRSFGSNTLTTPAALPSDWNAQRRMLADSYGDACRRLELVKTLPNEELGGCERLQYPQYTYVDEQKSNDLSKQLMTVLQQYAFGRISLRRAISEIAYRLLLSPAPPTTGTYNLLINRFSRLGEKKLADIVIESLSETYMAPDEITVTTVLTHFERKNDYNAFSSFVNKFQASKGHFLIEPPGLLQHQGTSLAYRRQSNTQVLRLTPIVAYSIIQGYLKFWRQHEALKWFQKMQAKGIEPDLQLMNVFLKSFAIHRMWDSGILVWNIIKEKFMNSSMGPLLALKDRITSFHYVLWLCRNCEQTSEFKEIYEQGLSEGFSMSDLFIPLKARGFTVYEDVLENRRRLIHVLEYRLHLITEDLKFWALQVLASRIYLSGMPLSTLVQMFRKHSTDEMLRGWLSERKWIFNQPWTFNWPQLEQHRGADGMYPATKILVLEKSDRHDQELGSKAASSPVADESISIPAKNTMAQPRSQSTA